MYRNASGNISHDFVRILIVGVFVSEADYIGILISQSAHLAAFPGIAAAASATKDGDYFCGSGWCLGIIAEDAIELLERVRSMGVVDYDGEVLTGLNFFHAAGNITKTFNSRFDLLDSDPLVLRGSHGSDNVVEVE